MPDEMDRLPPPAFPPGQSGGHVRRTPRPDSAAAAGAEGIPDDAFISPDEPIVRSASRIAPGAFISPDEPMPSRDSLEAEDAVVTGIGDDAHMGSEDLVYSRHTDPAVIDLALKVGRLADAIRDKGEAGLRATPDMTKFEVTLRAYCVGYLAGQREIKPD